MGRQEFIWWLCALTLVFVVCGCQQESPPPVGKPAVAPAPVERLEQTPLMRDSSARQVEARGKGIPSASLGPAVTVAPKTIMHEPVELQRVELISETMAVWRQHAGRRPTLLLLLPVTQWQRVLGVYASP